MAGLARNRIEAEPGRLYAKPNFRTVLGRTGGIVVEAPVWADKSMTPPVRLALNTKMLCVELYVYTVVSV
jgi:hypothetical protein